MTAQHVPSPAEVKKVLFAELVETERHLRGLRALHQNLLNRRGDLLVGLRDLDVPVSDIAARLGVSRGTIDKTLRNHVKATGGTIDSN